VPALDRTEATLRFVTAPVARLATLRADGSPRLVPITFVVMGGLVCSAVDDVKPKTTRQLARLRDIAHDPRVGLLVDHYAADWSQLWWVRVDGTAEVQESGTLYDASVRALARKYLPYAAAPPAGPLVVISPTRWTGWTAAS
jgi:PPOX class probable F420-dependent enzyme